MMLAFVFEMEILLLLLLLDKQELFLNYFMLHQVASSPSSKMAYRMLKTYFQPPD